MYVYALKSKPPVLDKWPCTIELHAVDGEDEADFYGHDTHERLVDGAAEVGAQVPAAVLLGGDGGLRRNEILALNLGDIAFMAGQFFVRRSVFWKKGKAIVTTPKGGKAKPVPCTPRLLKALRACRHLRGERLLDAGGSEPVTPKVLKRLHLSPSAVKEAIDMLARSRAEGGVSVVGHSHAHVVPNEGQKR